MRSFTSMFLLLLASVSLRAADEYSRVKDITLDLRVDSSFGHFTYYAPPETNQHLQVTLGDIPSLRRLEFTNEETQIVGLVSLPDRRFRLTHFNQTDRLPEVITMRFVSENEDRKDKVTLDIELFSKDNFDTGTARAWIILEIRGHLTQGIAGLTGTFGRKTTYNKVPEDTARKLADPQY